ncbi:LLM class flavin-dependent oxidoreductase [Actinoplanes sp. ATCC 53533]|uniref:LLM class flavin-dependent oxidoreductase n=1 Tax=Actinoplanes sp. ATCC 53533 TaxID=1288362 RepID=UPI001F1B8B09|nr:LLM class flavin-dependent oxidoreductase [Actinoplanes sp. ATCC 53533]
MAVPLSILDLAPIVSGGTAGDALRRTLDLARHAEHFGYARYWVAEHHFTPGVASSQPALLLGQIAAVTDHIRLGSGAVQTGHQTALSIVEQFGLLDALHPGRFDLGLGRSGQRRQEALTELAAPAPPPAEEHVVDGLLIPRPFSFAPLLASARSALFNRLLHQPGAEPPDFPEVLDTIEALLAGPITDADGNEARAVPGEGANLELWILGSSGGQSARVAGERGLPFAANYHVAPAKVLEAVAAYREAFRPSATLAAPHVMGLRGRGRGPGRRDRPAARGRLRAVGAQHPDGGGGAAVPVAGRGRGPRLDRGGTRAGRRPGGDAVRRFAADRGRAAADPATGDGGRRTARHHGDLRPRGPGALVRAAGQGVAGLIREGRPQRRGRSGGRARWSPSAPG